MTSSSLISMAANSHAFFPHIITFCINVPSSPSLLLTCFSGGLLGCFSMSMSLQLLKGQVRGTQSLVKGLHFSCKSLMHPSPPWRLGEIESLAWRRRLAAFHSFLFSESMDLAPWMNGLDSDVNGTLVNWKCSSLLPT